MVAIREIGEDELGKLLATVERAMLREGIGRGIAAVLKARQMNDKHGYVLEPGTVIVRATIAAS